IRASKPLFRALEGLVAGPNLDKPGHDKETSGVWGMTNRVELSVAGRFPFADGHEFGAAGAYVRLVGRAHFAVEPHAPAQQGITDIDKAPTDAEGLVRVSGRFSFFKPPRARRANRGNFFHF